MNFSIKTDYNVFFVIAALILSLVISYFYYKRSGLQNPQKKILSVIRFLSLFFILLLLLSPVISFLKTIKNNPVNVYLIDNSESLLLENRAIKTKEALINKLKSSEPDGSDNLYFLFSENLNKETDKSDFEKIPFSGINNFNTNLTATLNSFREKFTTKNISSVTIVSDGIINEGGNPLTAARSLNAPFNYILIGDTVQKNDLVLRNLFYNKTAFIESNVPINVEINSYNYDRNVRVNLYEENKIIGFKDLKVESSKNNYELTFNVMSDAEKSVKYKIEIEGLEDEITNKNNYQEFFIKFVNNKFKVFVLSGGPSADYAFIKEELLKINNFEITFRTQKSSSEFYEGPMPDISGFNAFLLIGYPTAVSDRSILNDISRQIEKSNSSILFFASRNTDYNMLSIIAENLPFRINSFSDQEEETGIKPVSRINDDIFKDEDRFSSINSFPNIFKTKSTFAITASAETFFLTSTNSEPAFVIQNTERNHSAAFLAYGLYKWRLNKDKNNSDQVLNYLIAGTIAAITDKEANKSFTVETSKPVYSKYEDVKFSARITNFEKAGGEQIKISIIGNGFDKNFDMTKKDNGYYEGVINIPSDGDYNYSASLYSKNNLVETIQSRFAVGENNFEYKLTRADNSILKNLAGETGGMNFTEISESVIKDSLQKFSDKSGSILKTKMNFELNLNPYFLGIIIFLLCLEWYLRKRNSLP